MSKRNKLQKFAEILSFPNVYENFDIATPVLIGKDGEETELKGLWAEKHFGNDYPITLELACGKGEYSLGLARRFPHRNFIGVDIKGARIWRGAKTALQHDIQNVAFLRTRIEYIERFFTKGEVEEIWITFPDPFLKKGKSNRRLTAPNFLQRYAKILKNNGLIHLKTDDDTLYQFTLETLNRQNQYRLLYHNNDIYAKDLPLPELTIKTFYETQHLAAGKTIKYIRFQLL
ncbi:MAG TPA: tRNA (guanosine(46)-N7)-methyltransferase TrmB [Bacteroidetes bacterium]|nr:tRNA (guanosine(46)-N7)-methyltransferase TrmB [Bacteroidota bacterium]